MSHPDLSSPMPVYLYCLKYLFGMPAQGIKAYEADNSGPLSKPYPGSNVQPEARIDYGLHHGYLQALSGPGLAPISQRIFQGIYKRIDTMENQLRDDWTHLPNLYKYFQKDLSSAIIEALFGPMLLNLHPDIVDNLWKYDDMVPWLAKGIPSWINPGPYRARDKIRGQLKDWYVHARRDFDESKIYADGDGDPCWGSELMRERHKLLERSHDDDSLASSDLGSIWAVIANTVPSILYTVLHIFKDPELLQRIRAEVSERFNGEVPTPWHVKDLRIFHDMPLLESVYAETLRLYVKVWFMVSSAHTDVALGRWRLPRGDIGVINSDVSHMDESFWNTQEGRHPVDKFWAERFLVDPKDPLSGPINPAVRMQTATATSLEAEKKTPYFSQAGLMGAWIPYGGGPAICPGRHLAKHIIFFVCSLLVSKFDIEVQTSDETIKLDSSRFGLGVGRPLDAVPVTIRMRSPNI
ncbi:hypothetical protein NPX13_g8441 [Xylaria arbuscula]|uniref:Cytochrome P450 n=1 Tax=Xylaria arbuscula TaxID=114810 RepID=A0A9W8N866_9PEZI|nr:hypothetical protein NPX13_g8441 [Xylaria arbuscula]